MIKLKSFAKINFFLKIISKEKGYHRLYSLISQINFFDEIFIRENKKKKNKIYFTGPFKIQLKNNSITKVLSLINEKFPKIKKKNFDIYIKKNIPNGSGLGAASSNATVLFNFFKKRYNLRISKKNSIKLLENVGKDCPIFINSKTKLLKSAGGVFYEYQKKLNFYVLVIFPYFKLSTQIIFKNIKKISKFKKFKTFKLYEKNEFLKVCKFYGNDLLASAQKVNNKMKSFKKFIDQVSEDNFYSMTGSGSAFFIISDNKKSLLKIQKIIKKQRNNFWTILVKTL
ncbi:MAG: 4-(cytidine 5'-diphospho)-2-C-methyl-D-erythritol kinase [Candidatus Pelagibacter sp.]|nr:4-(cytidine 5'-diphospho)-2-C-methyl-D-erythritol kinase [Candidatus Pelagibacter sp.]